MWKLCANVGESLKLINIRTLLKGKRKTITFTFGNNNEAYKNKKNKSSIQRVQKIRLNVIGNWPSNKLSTTTRE